MRSNGPSFRNGIVPLALVVVAMSAIVALAASRPAHAQFANPVQWLSVGPSGSQIGSGKINAFAFVQSNPNIMYMAGGWGNTPRESPSQSGIYRTTDRGGHWKAANNGLTNPDGTISSVVNGLWLDQSNPSVVLAATEFGGTFRSTDAGSTWVNVDRAESTQFAKAGSTLFVASRRGVLASTNDGATWTVSLPASGGASTVVSAGGATYAGLTNGDVYRLTGSAWSRTGHPGTGPVHDLAVDPFKTSIVYANVDDKTAWNQNLYGSINGGKTWTFINCPCSIGAQAIAFSLVVPHRLYYGDDGGGAIFYFTADGNPNPTISGGANPFGVDMRYIVPASNGTHSDDACYLLMDQGLFFASHCASGTAPGLADNVPDTLAYDVKVTLNASHAIVPLQDNSAAASIDGGKTWFYNNSSGAGEGGEAFIDPKNPRNCYFAHPDQGLWVSRDGCQSFSGPVTTGTESLTFDPVRAGKLYSISGAFSDNTQIVVSTDGGNSWNPVPWRFTSPYQVAVSPFDAKTIIVATGTATTPSHLYYTHNGGTTWQKASGLPQTAGFNLQGVWFPVHRFYAAFEPKTPGKILLSDHDPKTDNVLVFRSIDNAKSFSLVRTFVQPVPARPWPHLLFPTSKERATPEIPYYATRFFGNRLSFNPHAPTGKTPAVVLTTRFGAFASFDDGSSWQRIDTAAIAHHFVGADWNNGFLYLASFGQGVIRSATPLQ